MIKTGNGFGAEVKSQIVGQGLNEDLKGATAAGQSDCELIQLPMNPKSTTPKPRINLTIKAPSKIDQFIDEYVSPRRRPEGAHKPLIERPATIRKPDSTDNGRYHSRKEMVARAKEVLQAITYDRREGVDGIFDEKEHDGGWLYLYKQIFQLPRSERFVLLL